ncbi:circularly permuted type 2 ATP-grasp protein [Adlercreutzia faecimuris]|uniref:Circularly permuted type 2 ATP-grasp protein n=1 Tax=Adlercreutzia faecimuris TaxID=2897341 RepID=A0ABS9WDF0_9ACTN|nr:circularly permuted type 2 ATP-grasp protein [Adlercreutzia sp. JBNU-10]MCI2240889.1 circularly permuted type 2 ATP-grasp protein [Adlercreutzia sp. JBNU-10]
MYSKLVGQTDKINQQLARYGVKFGIYKDGRFDERLFPFDAVPRVIGAEQWAQLERGLVQRVDALNAYLRDLHSDARIIRDGVIPEHFAYASSGYLPQCEHIMPPKGIYSHISGIDLVEGEDGEWYVLEDNLRIPSGASYPLVARGLCRRCDADTFRNAPLVDNRDYGARLREVVDYVNCGGINVVLTPGRYNSAYFEHAYLAEQIGAVLAEAGELFVEDEVLYYRDATRNTRVGAVYRRLSDEFLDPLCFLPESLIGVPNLMAAYRAGNVAILNAPGNGAADDKGIYYFVPQMIRYYLGEEPILKNAPTYLPYYPEDLEYVLANAERLVIKDVAEAGGYGVVFGSELAPEALAELLDKVRAEPRRFIAQEVVDFKCLDTWIGGEMVPRKADLRAFVLSGRKTTVWPSGLTRYAREAGSCVVNSSQGGGFKDTWVLSR